MVSRWIGIVFGALFAASACCAQEAQVRAWVDSTTQRVDKPFWLHIEAVGEHVKNPRMPQISGLIINGSPTQQSRSTVRRGTLRLERALLLYPATATEPGKVTIPPIKLVVNGNDMFTEAIELIIEGVTPIVPAAVGDPFLNSQAPPAGGQGPSQGGGPAPVSDVARIFVEDTTVTLGIPFWLYLEVKGQVVDMPKNFIVDGLSIDFKNARRTQAATLRQGDFTRTVTHAMLTRATRGGSIQIAPMGIAVDGTVVRTNSLKLTVIERPRPEKPINARTSGQVEERDLFKEDLLFINLETDKVEVYQGEPIVLKKQLWRINYGRINSGPYRGGLIIPPTTEGFYVIYLDPITYEAERPPWKYDVAEERMVLYPTAIGALKVGQWHWEGVALVNRRNVVRRNKIYYQENAGPIDINVKPLPERPPGFSGAVGNFEVTASLSDDMVSQGTPLELVVTVKGQGNPDAIGEPVLPKIDWAQVSGPRRETEIYDSPGSLVATVERRFTYNIIPLQGGDNTLEEIRYVFFSPESEAYETATAGPFRISVKESPNMRQHLVVANDISLDERLVDILGEDIRPIIARTQPLAPRKTSFAALPIVASVPVIAYLGLLMVMVRKRRFQEDTAYARSFRAKSRALKRLRTIGESAEPMEDLYRTIMAFVADSFNRHGAGLTSTDVKRFATELGIDNGIRDNLTKILRACERARYASQTFSSDEMRALIEGAEASVAQLDEAVRSAGLS